MANARFTRDEVILALDVLYSSETRLSADSDEIRELCSILQELPIHPESSKKANFRNKAGVSGQLGLFVSGCRTGRRDLNVGKLFFTIAQEYEHDHNRLHLIANAIRRNKEYFGSEFGSEAETAGFPEGVLLGHLHRLIEQRDGKKPLPKERCAVFQLQPELLYRPCGTLLEQHLIVDPVAMDGAKHYDADCFITVCPNCHAALHRRRPWLNKENCEALLL